MWLGFVEDGRVLLKDEDGVFHEDKSWCGAANEGST